MYPSANVAGAITSINADADAISIPFALGASYPSFSNDDMYSSLPIHVVDTP